MQVEPQGWTVHEYSAIVGYGRKCYEQTRINVLSWRVMDSVSDGFDFTFSFHLGLPISTFHCCAGCFEQVEWAGIHVQEPSGMIATFARLQIGVGWAMNPCRSVLILLWTEPASRLMVLRLDGLAFECTCFY